MNNTKNDFLMHYGVKGMKWGVRHDKFKQGVGRAYNKSWNGLSTARKYGVRGGYHNIQSKRYQSAIKSNSKDIRSLRKYEGNSKSVQALENVKNKNTEKATYHNRKTQERIQINKQNREVNYKRSVERGAKLVSKNKGSYGKIAVKSIAGSAAVVSGTAAVALMSPILAAPVTAGTIVGAHALAIGGSAAGAAVLAKGARDANDVRNFRKRNKR